MKRNGIKITGVAVGVVALSMTGILFHLSDDAETVRPEAAGREQQADDGEHNTAPGAATRTAASGDIPTPAGDRPQHPPIDWAEFEAWAAEDLRAEFSQTILNRGTQASLMELRQFLKERYPQDWEAKLRDLLYKAFPGVADQVLDTISKLDAYNEWLETNKADLATMRGEEIKDALWQRRRELFAEDAAEVWASDFGTEYVRDILEILEESHHVPIEHKLEVLKSAIDESELGVVSALAPDITNIMLGRFLDMESVQDELRQMGPRERAESLRSIRRSMGIDERNIERMEELDAEREERWQDGLRYMEERDELTEYYEGARLQEELRLLRERHFAKEARIIEAEEASGFFRYDRRRVYGRN